MTLSTRLQEGIQNLSTKHRQLSCVAQFDVTDIKEKWKGYRLNGQGGDWALDLSVKDERKSTGVKKFSAFCGTRRLITVFTGARRRTVS
jgi:hypothetical protein